MQSILHLPTDKDKLKDSFFLFLQDSFPVTDRNSSTSNNDNTCLWFKNIQSPPIDKQTTIKIKSTEYVIS